MNVSNDEKQKKYLVYFKKLLTKKQISIVTNNYSEAKIIEKLIKYKF